MLSTTTKGDRLVPRENRVITFTADEVLQALRQFAEVIENKALPPDPAECLAFDGATGCVEIVGSHAAAGSSRHVFCGQRLVQALVYWCVSRGISLPRRGVKATQIIKSELQLTICLPDTETLAERSLDAA
jgi:hypothetical protein